MGICTDEMSECPACGEKVKTGVAVCKHCHAILDADKAAKHGLGPAGQGMGLKADSRASDAAATEQGRKGSAMKRIIKNSEAVFRGRPVSLLCRDGFSF